MISRREFSTATKRAAWERAGGRCEGLCVVHGTLFPTTVVEMRCGAPLDYSNFHYDHIDPDWYSKNNELENVQVLCTACHKAKTAHDVKAIAKSKRIIDKRAKARKVKGRPLPGTKASGIRKRMSGAVERW